ncbi:hypothetical protein LLE49_09120 [Alicyclobacillus tolerans]|uniref:hypothetical protein n=1 Tax=Alicyclobacillus tolerans TaxID=90970 RepID=UPI001F17A276|nr:hypothetical protein [Alicyclobacillus tolerans]MCF8564878.1 hypothetical protein [Alicyclobacillus tolerans]
MTEERSLSDLDRELIISTREHLIRLSKQSPSFERNIEAIGHITFCLRGIGIRPVVVGGLAVEVYTFGTHPTVDVDIVVDEMMSFLSFLEIVGFEPKKIGGKHWYHRGLDLPIEIVGEKLHGSLEKVNQVIVENVVVFVIGIEDLILERLRYGVYWKSVLDMEIAETLLVAYKDKLDIEYLDLQAISQKKRIVQAWEELKDRYFMDKK